METRVLESILVLLFDSSRATLGSTVDTCIASVSMDSRKNFHLFYFLVNSDPEVGSVVFSVSGAVCTVDTSVAYARGYLWIISTRSLYLAVTF